MGKLKGVLRGCEGGRRVGEGVWGLPVWWDVQPEVMAYVW